MDLISHRSKTWAGRDRETHSVIIIDIILSYTQRDPNYSILCLCNLANAPKNRFSLYVTMKYRNIILIICLRNYFYPWNLINLTFIQSYVSIAYFDLSSKNNIYMLKEFPPVQPRLSFTYYFFSYNVTRIDIRI